MEKVEGMEEKDVEEVGEGSGTDSVSVSEDWKDLRASGWG